MGTRLATRKILNRTGLPDMGVESKNIDTVIADYSSADSRVCRDIIAAIMFVPSRQIRSLLFNLG